MDALAKLADYTGIENVKGITNESTEEMEEGREELVNRICQEVGRVMTTLFVVPCNVPENSDEVTLDFENKWSDEEGGSFEWKLLREIIRLDVGSERRIVGVQGGAGVGKSCALRGVGRRDEVKFLFRGGIYYLSLGMDATVETLKTELLTILRFCGRGNAAEELKGEKSLRTVLEKVREAIEGRKSLVLIDDLWPRHGLGPGTVDQVRQVLEKDSGGVVVVATRDTVVAAKGTVVVRITPRGVLSAEAKRVLLVHAKMKVEEITEAFQLVLYELLQLCGGLPLCLAVIGRGLRQHLLQTNRTGVKQKLEAWEEYLRMMRKGEKLVFEDVDVGDYENLWSTLSVALTMLEERRGQYSGSSGGLSLSQMYRSFCIMKKQTTISFRVLARMWALESADEALYVVKSFSSVGLADIVIGSDGRASGVRLHDLTHDFCVACAKKKKELSEWHSRVLEGYIREQEREGGLREWWNVADDGYIFENVCRHLWRSGNIEELIELLLNRRWAQARLRQKALLSWIADFGECEEGIATSGKYGREEEEEWKRGLQLVRDAVSESWTSLTENGREFSFQMDARLSECEEQAVLKFVESVRAGEEKPCAKALGRWWGRPGSGSCRGEFPLSDVVRVIAVNDEQHVAVAGVDSDVVFVDTDGMQVLKTCAGHATVIQSVAISADGARAFSWSEDGVLLEWDMETRQHVRRVTVERYWRVFTCAAICPQRSIVVTGSLGGTVEVWDLNSGERIGEAMGGFNGVVMCVSVSRDGCHIASGQKDGTVCLWNAARGNQAGLVLSGHAAEVNSVAFRPDGQLAASGSSDNTIRIWDVGSGTLRGDPIDAHDDDVRCVGFSEDGRQIASGGRDRTVRIWDVETVAQIGRVLHGHTHIVNCLAMIRDGQFLVSGGFDYTIRVWSPAAAIDEADEQPENVIDVQCLTMSADRRWFFAGSDDGAVRVYEGASGKQVGDAMHVHDWVVACIAVSPCGRRIVSGSWDKTLRICEIEKRAQVGEPLRGHTHYVDCVAYSPNGLFIVSGSSDKTVRVWSTATHAQIGAAIGGGSQSRVGRMPKRLKRTSRPLGFVNESAVSYEESGGGPLDAHTAEVNCVSVSTDGGRIICGVADNRDSLYVWDISSRKLVGALPSKHNRKIVRLDVLVGDVVRSVDFGGDEKKWRLDDEEGLIRLTDENDGVQGAEGTSTGGLKELVWAGRQVRVRGSNVQLATLPAEVRNGEWRYNKSSGIVGIVLADGRLVFLKTEW